MKRAALIVYALAVAAVGAFRAWSAPLSWDEQQFYFPAIRTLALRLPHVPLDYALPQPPAMLIVQATAWRLTGSIILLRVLSTLAVIAAVFVAAKICTLSTRSSLLTVLMVGTFPAVLLNAWSMKQHAFTLLFLLAALLSWRRRRIGWTTTFLALATLTNQLALALCATFGILALLRLRRERSRAAVAELVWICSSVLPLFALMAVWHGVQPPSYAGAFPSIPSARFNPGQLLLALILAGFWIAPLVVKTGRLWRPLLVLVPLCLLLLHWNGILRPVGANIYAGAVGPVTNSLRALPGVTLVAGGTLAALGVLFFRDVPGIEPQLYFLICVAALMRVPYSFESYYALVVGVVWPMMADAIGKRRGVIQWIYIASGTAYAMLKVMTTGS
ncbi:MAG TPA: hypothetical protein VF381_09855 [Thermoanaerobaculia bacterium]